MINTLYKYYAKLFARPFLFPLHRAFYNLSLRGMGLMNYADAHTSGEVNLLKRLGSLLTVNTVVDIGANEGLYASLAMKHLKPRDIFCIEAHPLTCDRLRRFLSGSTANIHILQYAVCEAARGNIDLYDYNESGTSQASTIQGVSEAFFAKSSRKISVPATSIDALAAEHGIERIDLLKIDIEGGEFSALQGAKTLLSNQAIDYIQFEFNEMNILSGAHMKDFLDLLGSYDLYRLLPSGLLPIHDYSPRLHEIFAFQNILAVRRGLPI